MVELNFYYIACSKRRNIDKLVYKIQKDCLSNEVSLFNGFAYERYEAVEDINNSAIELYKDLLGAICNDEVDVVESLTKGNLIGYATDVLDGENTSDVEWLSANPLWKELMRGSNIIVTPHIGGATIDSLLRVDNFVLKVLSTSK